MLERATHDGRAPAVCTECGARAEEDREPDAENDPCEECGAEKVSSVLVIAGVI